ncbi:MAG: c-type cytochrome [Chloroflexi bacterium]|nr:c-type cytochrome [Chloroflexota bacterium]
MKGCLRAGCVILVLLLIVIVTAGVGIFVLSNNALDETYNIDAASVPADIPDDEESIAEGQRLFQARLCAGCHGGDAGGDNLIDEPVFAVLDAPNLTSGEGGRAAEFEVEDWVRAIRHGLSTDDTSLMIMPAAEYQIMRDEEIARIIAYLENAEPVDNEANERTPGPIARFLLVYQPEEVFSAEAVLDDPRDVSTVEVGATAEYGNYLTTMTCIVCHGDDLDGGNLPGEDAEVPSLHITDEWTYDQFVTLIREGTQPDGSRVSDDMPWENLSFMTDEELQAVWAYLETLE